MTFLRPLPNVRSTPNSVLSIRNFSGGLNNRDSAINILDNESPDLMNVEFEEGGAVRKRNGTALVGDDVGNAKILGLFSSFYGNSSAKQVMVTNVGTTPPNLYYRTTGNWTVAAAAAFADADVEFDSFLGVSAVQFWFFTDGTTLRTYNPSSDAVAAAAASPATIGPILRVYQNRLYVRGSDASKPERIYFSNLGNGEVWGASDYFDVPSQTTAQTGSTGDAITALVSFENRLIIFKRYSIWYWDTNVLRQITSQFGCVGKRAWAIVGNWLYFFSYDGIYRMSGNFIEPVSLKIKDTIDAIPDARKPEVAMEYFDNKLFVATAAAAASNNNIVLVNYPFLSRDNEGQSPWTYWKGGSSDTLDFSVLDAYQSGSTTDPILTGGRATADSAVLQLLTGTTDYPSSAAIVSYYKTKQYPLIARYKRLHVYYLSQSTNSKLKVAWNVDFGQSGVGSFDFDMNVYGTDVYGTGVYGTARYGGQNATEGKVMVANSGKRIQYEFRNDQASQPWTLYEIKQVYKSKKLR